MSCPVCGHKRAWTKCWECGWEMPEHEDGPTDATPEAWDGKAKCDPDCVACAAERPSAVPETRPDGVIVLPWEVLASDNLRKRYKGDGEKAWAGYKNARDNAHLLAIPQVASRPKFPTGDVRMSVVFTLPDLRRRDPNNLTKMICDALTGVAYEDDAQIAAMSWVRAGIDKDGARAEVTVEAIP